MTHPPTKDTSDSWRESEVYMLAGGWESESDLRAARKTVDPQDRRNPGHLPQHDTAISAGSGRCVGAQTPPQAAVQAGPVQGVYHVPPGRGSRQLRRAPS